MIRIFLIGYMGAGKTTLGNALARSLHISFIDTDQYIEGRFHRSVRDLFAESGEEYFRNIEKNMLREVGEFEDVVISTGGGAPCFFNNMEYMKEMGHTVFLSVSEDVLFNRLKVASHSRPVLQNKTGEELLAFIHDGLAERIPFYSKAQYTFCADNLESISQIQTSVDKLEELLCL
jgi:shikimate kinase